jgi:TPR repeat protein
MTARPAVPIRSVTCVAALLLAIVLPVCAGAQARKDASAPNPILMPGAPWSFDGFIVDAPQDADWASFSKDKISAELGKKFEDGRTAAVVIESRKYQDSVVRAEDLLALMKQEQAAPDDPKAMKLLEYMAEVITPKGLLCGRPAARFEDGRGKPAQPGLLTVRALTCTRPDRPDVVVSLRFAERTAAGQTAQAGETGEKFLTSLRFVPPNEKLVAEARAAIGAKRGDEAVKLLTSAAEAGDAEASAFLGALYLYGGPVPENLPAARKWLEVAARSGRVDALYNLGAMYDKALGVPRDPREAMKWFTLAADQRDDQAQLNLALFYLKGDGVEKDVRTAEEWLHRSAGNGNRRAQGILASGKYKQQ